MNTIGSPLGRPARAEQLLVVLSDIEMAAGGSTDDFPQSDFLADLVDTYRRPPYDDIPVSLVFNGDTFDFLKLPVDGVYPHYITADVALQKWALVRDAHGPFFDALAAFLAESPTQKVYFVVGNHDMELLFPEVQEAIQQRLGHPEQVVFPGLSLRMGSLHIEHGHQLDSMFQFDPEQLFLEYQGEQILNLPWGSVALLEVAMPLQPMLYHLDRMRPRKRVLDILPEVKELLTSLYWRYWTRDYLRGLWNKDDPFKKLDWTMLKEIIYRFRSRDPDIWSYPQYQQMLKDNSDIALLVTGHDHCPGWWSWLHQKYLHTGCLRNEFYFVNDPETGDMEYESVPRVYAEVWMAGEAPIRSYLVEIDGPELPPDYMPANLFSVIPGVQKLLGPAHERSANQDAWEAQEMKEASQQGEGTSPSENEAEAAEETPPPASGK